MFPPNRPIAIAVACLLAAVAVPLRAQTPAAPPAADPTAPSQTPPLEAEILRKTAARVVDASGLASTPYPVNKGARFDVVSQSFSEVVLARGGTRIRVPKTDVRIYPKDPNAPAPPPNPYAMPPQDPRAIEAAKAEAARAAEAAARAAFQPGGQLTILSAKYSLSGNAPRNVKNKIDKLIPTAPLTAPVRILVTDQLHRSAANEPEAIVYTGRTSTNVVHLRKNVLTVVYEYNGQKLTKEAEEGTAMFLP
ncbi:MAG TPA: hypothetical protein VD994_22110 [Prosthecobacter sp.]|nr:hypothetical protein [Prosthecobacter sp.]